MMPLAGHRDAKVFHVEEREPRSRCWVPGVSVTAILLIQIFHFGVVSYVWVPDKPQVNKDTCTCGCWDTVFKGTYESPPAQYKHFYFNTTWNTLKIWVLTVVALITLYESLKHLLNLYQRRKLRPSMVILFFSVLFSHYYSWWNYCNYWNDDFYRQWYHQLFFTSTELVSTGLVLSLCSEEAPLTPSKLLGIASIALTHILVSGVDQFVVNVLFLKGARFQIVRDIGFMLPDVLHVVLPFSLLLRLSRECGIPLNVLVTKRLVTLCGSGILFATLFAKFIVF